MCHIENVLFCNNKPEMLHAHVLVSFNVSLSFSTMNSPRHFPGVFSKLLYFTIINQITTITFKLLRYLELLTSSTFMCTSIDVDYVTLLTEALSSEQRELCYSTVPPWSTSYLSVFWKLLVGCLTLLTSIFAKLSLPLEVGILSNTSKCRGVVRAVNLIFCPDVISLGLGVLTYSVVMETKYFNR